MTMDQDFKTGDLIMTEGGMYALVLFQEGDELGVFQCNGLASIEPIATVKECLIGLTPDRANFVEALSQSIAWHLQSNRPLLSAEGLEKLLGFWSRNGQRIEDAIVERFKRGG